MKQTRNGKTLRVAVGASLAVHLILASLVHAYPVEADQAEQPTPAEIIHVVLPKPTPTPAPAKPHVTERKPQSPAVVRPRVQLVRTHSRAANAPPAHQAIASLAQPPQEPPAGGDAGPSTATPMSTAAPATPTPKPACSAPDVPAKAVDPVTPDEPEPVRDEGLTGTAKIRVDLNAEGQVVNTSVFASTGSQQLDQAALQAARQTRYAPEETDCKDVPGSYLFTVQFQ